MHEISYSEIAKGCHGAKLDVGRNEWCLSYFWSGPHRVQRPGRDARYRGESLQIPGWEVATYAAAWLANWSEFERLRNSLPATSGTTTKTGLMDMGIYIGGGRDGVWLRSFYVRIASREMARAIAESYRNAIVRAAEIQRFLQGT